MPYRLIQEEVSHDTVEVLDALLSLAKEGQITGIAYVCTMKRQRYVTDVAGFCYKNPTYTRGMVAFLSDKLAGLVHERDELETR